MDPDESISGAVDSTSAAVEGTENTVKSISANLSRKENNNNVVSANQVDGFHDSKPTVDNNKIDGASPPDHDHIRSDSLDDDSSMEDVSSRANQHPADGEDDDENNPMDRSDRTEDHSYGLDQSGRTIETVEASSVKNVTHTTTPTKNDNITTVNKESKKDESKSNYLSKRHSPWREPRGKSLPPPAKDIMVDHAAISQENEAKRRARKEKRKIRKLFQDSVVVSIPLSVTADIGVAMKRTREKRVSEFYKRFPALKPKEKSVTTDDTVGEDDNNSATNNVQDKIKGETTAEEGGANKKKKKAKKLKHVPQPQDYASVMDYLEAKYVQGVMIDDGASDNEGGGASKGDADDNDDDDEGAGSVYSETSFLDDSGLQRTVAEQVLGHATTTMLELQDDDAFFVNVGDLEVEESDLTKQNYDPLKDVDKKKKTRKRKKPTTEEPNKEKKTIVKKVKVKKVEKSKKDNVENESEKESGKEPEKVTSSAPPPKKKLKKSSTEKPSESPKKKKESESKTTKDKSKEKSSPAKKPKKTKSEKITDPATLKLQKASKSLKTKLDRLYKEVVQIIKNYSEEQLPRRAKPQNTRVTIHVPEGKKPGDKVLFANPHKPGQKCKVKIPAKAEAGGTFNVTVPKPSDEEIDPDKDYNKIGKDFYEKLDDYARLFDDWCDAEGEFRKAIKDKSFGAHFKKREKWDKLVTEFPKDLKTPLDKDYMKKILRRARQNRHKREQMAKQQEDPAQEGDGKSDNSDDNDDDSQQQNDDDKSVKSKKSTSQQQQEPVRKKIKMEPAKPAITIKTAKQTRTLLLPYLTNAFRSQTFNGEDFN